MGARVADQVVVELRMLVDQHIRAGKRAAEEFERNIGGMSTVAAKSERAQTQSADKAALAVERAEQRKAKAAERALAAQARAEDKRARLVIQAQRGTLTVTDAQEKAAAKIQAAQAKASATADRAAAKTQATAAKEAARAERAAAQIAKAKAREEAATLRAAATAEKAASKKIAADAKAALKAQQTADRAAAAQVKAAQRLAAAEAKEEQRKAAFVIRAQRGSAAVQASEARTAAAAEKAAQRQAVQDLRAEQRQSALVLRAQRANDALQARQVRDAAAAQRVVERQAAAEARAERARASLVLNAQRGMASARQQEERAAAQATARLEREERQRTAILARQARTRAQEQSAGLAGIRGGLRGGVSAIGLGAVVGTGALLLGARELAVYSDAWTNVRNKVAAANVPLAQVPRVQEQIYQQAQKTRTALETQANLFQRVTIAARQLGRSREEVFRFNEIVSKGLKIGGATSGEAASIATQVTQGLGSGFQGDELKAIRENAAILAQALAKEFNTNVGNLRKLGSEGKIAPDRFFKAVIAAGAEVDATFKTLTPTFEDFRTRVDNAFTRFVGLASTAAGTSREFQNAADGLVKTFEDPEVIQAAADALTEIVAAIKPMLAFVATLARNWEIFVAAGSAFVALKLIETVLGLAKAIKVLTIAMVGNPITALLVGGAAVVAYIYEITDGFTVWSEQAKKTKDEQDALNASIGQLSAMHPDVAAFFSAVESGAVTAAEGLKKMSAEARTAAAEMARLKLAQAQLDVIDARAKYTDTVENAQGGMLDRAKGAATLFLGGTVQDPRKIVEEYSGNLSILKADFQAGRISVDDYRRGVEGANAALADQSDTVKKAAKDVAAAQDEYNSVLDRQAKVNEILKAIQTAPAGASEGGGGGGGSGAAAGSGKAAKEKQSSVEKFLRDLKDQTAQLGLSNTALKEAELLAQYEAAAREDLNKKLQRSAELRALDIAQVKAAARQAVAVPAIIQIASDKLPQFNLKQQLATFEELKALLTDPAIIAALDAQGLSAVDATKAINLQIAAAKDTANGTTDAIKGIGDALQSGIQGAQSFEDALIKVGIALLQMLAQAAAFGGNGSGGPLGKLFDSLSGLTGGLVSLLGSGAGAGPNVTGLVPSQSTLGARASGGQATPGNIYQVGETGREWFAPTVPGQVISNSVIKNAARGGGGGGSGQPIMFSISMAGANGDRAIAQIAEAAVKRGLASVPEINRQHRIRFA